MTETEFRTALKQGVTGGFLFWGEEDYLKRHYLTQLRRTVLSDCPPGLEDFNCIRLTLEDGNMEDFSAALATPPMMSPVKFVEVTPPSMNAWREKERKAFLSILEQLPQLPDTVVAILAPRGTLDVGTPKKPTAFFKALSALVTPVEFPLQSGARLRRWVQRHFDDAALSITEENIGVLLARCAPDMTALSAEIDKVICYAKANGLSEVDGDVIASVTSPGLREDAFALANAVLAGDRTDALAALDVYRKRREEPIVVLGALSRVVSDLLTVAVMAEEGMEKSDVARAMKMHEYKAQLYLRAAENFGVPRLRAALTRCCETDLLMKSASMDYIPLERFICTLPRGAAARTAPRGRG